MAAIDDSKTAQTNEELEELLTPEYLERRWGLSRVTQASMRAREQIPFVMLGPRMPRYRRGEVEIWLETRKAVREPADPKV